MAERVRKVSASDTDAIAELEEAAHADLPPPGYAREETQKERADKLQRQIEETANLIIQGAVDPSKMEIFDEIANQSAYLQVSNRQSGFEYGWISKNNYGNNHFQKAQLEGWVVVQGDDLEAVELKGTTRLQAGGPPDSTRQLGDVILMRIPEERYIALKAREWARSQQLQTASDSRLQGLAHSLRDKGVIIRPFDINAGAPSGTEQNLSRQDAMKMLDKGLRAGNLPGMHIKQEA